MCFLLLFFIMQYLIVEQQYFKGISLFVAHNQFISKLFAYHNLESNFTILIYYLSLRHYTDQFEGFCKVNFYKFLRIMNVYYFQSILIYILSW